LWSKLITASRLINVSPTFGISKLSNFIDLKDKELFKAIDLYRSNMSN